MAGPFSGMVDFLNAWGVFNYLALLLAFILLYYIFMYVLKKKVSRIQKDAYRKVISLVLSALMVIGMYMLVFSGAGSATSIIVGIIFAIVVVFFAVTLIGRLMGIDVPDMLKKEFGRSESLAKSL